MNNTHYQLKKELSVLYPDFTDIELNETAENLVKFYTILVESINEKEEGVNE